MKQERRRFFRVKEAYPVSLHLREEDKIIQGEVMNAGAGGLLVKVSQPLPLHASLSLTIKFKDRSFFALAQVERVQDQEKGEYALTFTKLDEEDLLALFQEMSGALLKI